MDRIGWWKQVGLTVGWFGVAIVLGFLMHQAHARPNAAWKALRAQAESYGDMDKLRWFDFVSKAGTLRDDTGRLYRVNCCGEGDAYEADEWETDAAGNTVAILTCNMPTSCVDVPGKVHRDPGTKFIVPRGKMLVNQNPVNNTGHGVVWISPNGTNEDGSPLVFCGSEGTGN